MIRHLLPAVFAGLAVCTGLLAPAPCLAQATSYNITTIAGNTSGTPGFSGDGIKAVNAEFNEPIALAFDSAGNLYVADSANERIRKISAPPPSGTISTVAGNGTAQWAGDGAAAVNASLNAPYGILVDPAGNLYIADTANDVVRMVTASNHYINTIAGVNGNYGYFQNQDGGQAIYAYLDLPVGLAMDKAGNLYVADSGESENRIRIVSTPAVSGVSAIINTFAGNGWLTFQGDGGPATAASVFEPHGLSMDAAGNLYVADSDNHCIRKITPGGIISTVAGVGGQAGFNGDGLATKSLLNHPWAVVANAEGDLFISDYNNNRIRMVTAATGQMTTLAGGGGNPVGILSGYYGDGGISTNALLNHPTGMALDANGNLYIADTDNNAIRMLTVNAPTIGKVISASGYGAFPSIAPGSWVEIYGGNLAVDSRQWATSDFQGTTPPTQLDDTYVTIGGQQAYVSYISGGQINALVPSNVAAGQQSVVVKTAAGSSAAFTVNVNAVQPGLLAPPSFNIGGTQYAVAQLNGTTTFVLPPGSVPGYTTQRAPRGQTIVLYGIGFGPVSPATTAGQPGQSSTLTLPFQVSIGGVPAQVTYDGSAAGYYGLYAFGVTVPTSIPASDQTPVTFSLNGTAGMQTLYLAVQ